MPTLKDWIDGKWIENYPYTKKEAPEAAPSKPIRTENGYLELSDADLEKVEKIVSEKGISFEEAVEDYTTVTETPYPCDPPVLTMNNNTIPRMSSRSVWYKNSDTGEVFVRNKNNDGWIAAFDSYGKGKYDIDMDRVYAPIYERITQDVYKPLSENIGTINHDGMTKVLLELNKRVLKRLDLKELIGIQPFEKIESEDDSDRYCTNLQIVDRSTPGEANQITDKAMWQNLRMSSIWAFGAATCDDSEKMKTLEDELLDAHAQDAGVEIDQDIFRTLRNEATLVSRVSEQHIYTSMRNSVYWIRDTLGCELFNDKKESNFWALISPVMLTSIQTKKSDDFTKVEHDPSSSFVGTLKLNDVELKLYVDTYADDEAPILVGYKGSNKDSGMFYSPNKILNHAGVVCDPNTLEMVMPFTTCPARYCQKNMKDYYVSIPAPEEFRSFCICPF